MTTFDISQHDKNVYISGEDNAQLMHAEIRGPHDFAVRVGAEACVQIDKEYGPLVFMSLRVRPDIESNQWIIERGDEGSEWREVCRISGQLPGDFPHSVE